jgi:hypothetical protein
LELSETKSVNSKASNTREEFEIDSNLYDAVKALAKDENKTVEALLLEAVRDLLNLRAA